MTVVYTRVIVVMVSVLLLSWGSFANFNPAFAATPEDKLSVCHIPPDNPENVQTLSIPENALQDHLDHGDVLVEFQLITGLE